MAEVATIYRLYGAAGTKNSLAGIIGRFGTQDSAPGTNNPCKVPPAGQVYDSYWVTDCLGITGDYTQVRDIYIHGDGNFALDWGLDSANGGGLFVGVMDTGDHGLPIDVALHGSNAYAQATGTPGTKGDPIDTTHPVYSTQTEKIRDFDDCDSGSPLLIDSGPYAAGGLYSKAWVMALRTVPTSTYGSKTPKSVIVTYNIF
jgi:hypothetical protein